MPEPVLYLKSTLVAAGTSALVVLAIGGWRRRAGETRTGVACVSALGLGLAAGYAALSMRPAWPPASALDRFFSIVLPAVLAVELAGAAPRTPSRLAWTLRLGLAASIGRVLLHGSVYLSGAERGWTAPQTVLTLVGCAALLAVVWGSLGRLSQRAPGVCLPLALSQASLCGGIAVMLGGYLAGGEAALPLAAALAGAAVASRAAHQRPATPGIIGVGVVGLFSLLVIGRFFGRLSSGAALAVLLAPLCCWASEAPFVKDRKPWLKGAVCLTLTALPLLFVVAAARWKFNREMAPLLGPP